MEIWKPVPDLPLEASNTGRVRNVMTGCIYSPGRQTNGYLMICPRLPAGRRALRVHRLVCSAFHGRAPAGWECDHINHQRDDNRAENLRWVTLEQNRARRLVASGERHPFAKLSGNDVQQIRELLHALSNTAIGKRYGVARRTIADIRNGVTWL
jgi:hypothetical protein